MQGQSCTDCGRNLSELPEGVPCPSCSSTRRDVTLYPPTIETAVQIYRPSIGGQVIERTVTDTLTIADEAVAEVVRRDAALIEVLREVESASEEEITEAVGALLTPGVMVKLLRSEDGTRYTCFAWDETETSLLGKATDKTALGAMWALRQIILGHTGI